MDQGQALDARRVQVMTEAALEVARVGPTDLATKLLLRAAARCWWDGAPSALSAPVLEAVDAVGLEPDDPRRLAMLAYVGSTRQRADTLVRLPALLSAVTNLESRQLLAAAALVLGDVATAKAHLDACAAAYRAQGRLASLARTLASSGWGKIWTGAWDQVLGELEEARTLSAERGESFWVLAAMGGTAMILAFRGDHQRAESLAIQAQSSPWLTGARFVVAGLQHTRGVAALAAGRHDEAYEHLRRLMNPLDPVYHPDFSAWAISDVVDAASHTGRVEEARQAVARVQERAAQFPSPKLRIGVRYASAVLAEGAAAPERFADALSADLSAWPLDRARLQLAHGAWLRRERRYAESREPLRAARDGFEVLGATPWADRARAELRATGEASRRPAPTARDQLTPQELQIANLAARGLSNRQIAQDLFLSHRTVSSHLYRIFPASASSTAARPTAYACSTSVFEAMCRAARCR